MPFLVSTETLFPFIVGKSLYARSLIEVLAPLWLLLLLRDPSYRPPSSRVLLFAIYVLVGLFSAVFGVGFLHSIWSDYGRMLWMWDLVHWLLLAVVAASVLRGAGQWGVQLNVMLLAGLVLSVAAIGQANGVKLLLWVAEKARVDATLGNPSFLAAILVVTTVLGMGMLVRSFVVEGRDAKREASLTWPLFGSRLFWGAAAALGLWALFHTGTRGALVGLVAGAVSMPLALALRGNRRAFRPLLISAVALLLGLGVLFAADRSTGLEVAPKHRGGTDGGVTDGGGTGTSTRLVGTSLSEGSIAIRLESAQTGLQGFVARPLLGWGPEHFTVVYNRYADPEIFGYSSQFADQAHNKVVEELATKGALGTRAYLALWAGLVWAVVRRRRPAREEVLAYAVLGALGGYFVQNLFLFDTPAMLLYWSFLVAWIASQERVEAPVALGPSRPPRSRRPSLTSQPWLRGTVVAVVLALLGLSLYTFSYTPYAASRSFLDSLTESQSSQQQVQKGSEALDRFRPLARVPRMLLFQQVEGHWLELDAESRLAALQLLSRELERTLESGDEDYRFLLLTTSILQQQVRSLEDAERLAPLLERVQELAPERVQTHQILVQQELIKGNYREGIRIAEAYVARAPGTERYFRGLTEAAKQALGAGETE